MSEQAVMDARPDDVIFVVAIRAQTSEKATEVANAMLQAITLDGQAVAVISASRLDEAPTSLRDDLQALGFEPEHASSIVPVVSDAG